MGCLVFWTEMALVINHRISHPVSQVFCRNRVRNENRQVDSFSFSFNDEHSNRNLHLKHFPKKNLLRNHSREMTSAHRALRFVFSQKSCCSDLCIRFGKHSPGKCDTKMAFRFNWNAPGERAFEWLQHSSDVKQTNKSKDNRPIVEQVALVAFSQVNGASQTIQAIKSNRQTENRNEREKYRILFISKNTKCTKNPNDRKNVMPLRCGTAIRCDTRSECVVSFTGLLCVACNLCYD